ncbi:NADP-dependent oxidoreductase [Paraburkholderia sp. C35]|uniref:NADP-dependent oxidoreductase n=1 Tax=Paraburkholderia sp. C35 TaxID=2126993 RepID=UPI000D68A521|nr:NADP-dependent oxidoreductase [Paraburkholderia sp. C35]
MSQQTARAIVLASRPTTGPADESHFRLETIKLPELGPDSLLLKVKYLSLDPYMRGRMSARKSYAPSVEVGEKMVGEVVAEVVRTNSAQFKEGDLVQSRVGWCDFAVANASEVRKIQVDDIPVTTRLGVLGMPGFTAWSGLHLIGRPKAGETVVVSAASGPVGSLVGQLAKLAGARAVGIAGGPEKCRYLVEELGFDAAVDHRSADAAKLLATACPDGIDVYFENVGGQVWQMVLPLLNTYARIPVCGLVSYFSEDFDRSKDFLSSTMMDVLSKSLTLRGFINYEFEKEHFSTFYGSVSQNLRDNKILYKEDITEGLENAPQAFLGMLKGENFGKVLVKVS